MPPVQLCPFILFELYYMAYPVASPLEFSYLILPTVENSKDATYAILYNS